VEKRQGGVVNDMSFEYLDEIDCYGEDGQTKVCAVNAGSYN